MTENRQFDHFIILTMILTAAHDSALRWLDRDSDREVRSESHSWNRRTASRRKPTSTFAQPRPLDGSGLEPPTGRRCIAARSGGIRRAVAVASRRGRRGLDERIPPDNPLYCARIQREAAMFSLWKLSRHGFAALLIALSACATASAQTPTFSIEGVVSDEQQAVLPGVSVTVINASTGLTRTVVTDTGGRYVIPSMPTEGRYRIQAELTGFANAVREGLVFNAGQHALLNFTLRLSAVQETITVAGDAPIVQTTSSEVSSTVDRQQFETLPVKERNYFRLLTLDSNVVATGTGSNAVNVGGQEVWNFGTYVDGTNNFSKWLTLQRAPQLGSSGFALETVKEVQLITNQFSSEFGGHSAGVASMITKSGTNDVNGSLFVMIRPGQWDAAPPLSSVRTPYKQQQFGGTIGGPIKKDRI